MKNIGMKIALTLLFFAVEINQLMAGPGGKIAKQIFSSPIGRIIMILLVILFLPIIIYSFVREFIGVKKTKKDLSLLARISPEYFDEITLKNRMIDVFTRVHKAWGNENMEECSEFMSNWYWQNQQTVYLDKWKENNLENVSNLKQINSITPLHLRLTSSDKYNGSRVIMKIDANMEDYLRDRRTYAIVEGKKGYNNVETVWTLILEDGVWKVDNIEQSEMTVTYAKLENIVPVLQRAS